MEAEVLKSCLPDLVTAISDCVQPVSDQCLAKGLIPESVYNSVRESGGTSEDKARTLVLAVKASTETDSKCLEIFLKILDKQLPYGIKDEPLSKVRNKIAERRIEAEVPKCTPPQSIPREELAKESFALPNYLLDKFEKAVREHERAITEKRLLEDRIKVKPASTDDGGRELTDLKTKIEEIEEKEQKLDMQVQCDRIMVTTHHHQQIELAVREAEVAQKKMKEEMRAKELELKMEIQERDHKLETLKRDRQAESKLISFHIHV